MRNLDDEHWDGTLIDSADVSWLKVACPVASESDHPSGLRQGYGLSGIVQFSDRSGWSSILVYFDLNAKRPWRFARAVSI